ncbi:putative 2-dehydropantoate 2-reductase [Pseudomonas sp.]|uniref:putative 2-dehydropantoate 2-reductase n=1 Tax=Pseudomonas sp. TaxID=306 RepID=UPI003A97F085
MSTTQRPRIGIIGTGAIGGFYGLMLARAGFDVHFLLRSEYSAVATHGLQLNSAVHGPLALHPVQAYNNAEDMPRCDWLLVGAKTSSNASLVPAITQAAADGAKVLLLQNGLAVEDELRPLLPANLHLLGGLCLICVHRATAGVIEHQALGTVNIGYHSGPATAEERQQITAAGAAMFNAAGVDAMAATELAEARWKKLVWNVPYNGLSVLLNAGTTALMGDLNSRALIASIMDEVVAGAAACGYQIQADFAAKMLKATERMPDYLPSMYHDYKHRRPLELHAIYAAPLAAATAAGCSMPRIEALYQALQFIDQRNTQN